MEPHLAVRLHSLPNSALPESEVEYQEAVRRHRAVLAALHRDTSPLLLVILDTSDRGIWNSGEHVVHYPRARYWTRFTRTPVWSDASDDEPWVPHLWVDEVGDVPELEARLRGVSERGLWFAVTAATADWIYRPYEGGADIHLPDPAARLAVRGQFAAWLPPAEFDPFPDTDPANS